MRSYTPDGGSAVDVRALVRRPDAIAGFGDTRVFTEPPIVEFRL
jgi:hypothetical protein